MQSKLRRQDRHLHGTSGIQLALQGAMSVFQFTVFLLQITGAVFDLTIQILFAGLNLLRHAGKNLGQLAQLVTALSNRLHGVGIKAPRFNIGRGVR